MGTAKYGKIWYDEDIHDLRSVETEFPSIAFNDGVSSKTVSCEPTVSSLNDEIDFRISFDDSDDEDYTIPDKGDLRDYWIGILSVGDFLGTAPSYTSIKDLILRLCHKLIACSITWMSQAPVKVTVTDLFYLRGMDISSFVVGLAEHFGLLTEERLRGLKVITPELLIIDMAELVRLQIYMEINDTWAWVAMGPERQPDATTGAPGVALDTLAVDEGV
ncbi:hypothetical protein Tco_0516195 [Tanacetum coccineum]